jgi:Na+-transporting methylmalonyl-CoA/oxaloacetate decarboxylase beta subunit
MALVPVIQPPIIKLLTTRKERLIRMKPSRPVSKRVRILFPVVAFISARASRLARSASWASCSSATC